MDLLGSFAKIGQLFAQASGHTAISEIHVSKESLILESVPRLDELFAIRATLGASFSGQIGLLLDHCCSL